MMDRDVTQFTQEIGRDRLIGLALLALTVAVFTIALGWERIPLFALWCAGWMGVWLWLLPSD